MRGVKSRKLAVPQPCDARTGLIAGKFLWEDSLDRKNRQHQAAGLTMIKVN